MWNKLFKSKSKSSKNLSSDRGGGSTTSSALDLVPGSSGTNGQSSNPRNQTQTYYSNDGHFYDKELYEATGVVVLRGSEESEQHRKRRHEDQCRDSIVEGQMCGIPMRRSKFSSAFKSLSLKRGSNKNQLKLYHGIDISGTEALESGENGGGIDNVNFNANGSKRSSMLRPSKSDNNLSEKPKYPDPEKEDPDYIEQYKGGGNENDDQPRYRQDSRERQISPAPRDPFKEISPEPPSDLELRPCPICARKFVPPSLAKHISICERIQTKKRKPFDSSRQRREGTELASYLPKNFGLPQGHPAARVSPPKTTIPVRKFSKTPTPERKDYGRGSDNIMSTSLTLTSSMMATTSDGDSFSGVGAGSGSGGGGGGGGSGVGSGGSTTSTTRPTLKRSLSQQNEPCPYCERCFGFKAYDRHVEWCREKALLSKNANNTQSISAAKERLQARLQYKVPQIKSKRAFTRDKYSGSLSCGGSTSSLADLDLPLPRHRSHLNSMSSSLSSDNKSDPPSSTRKVTPTGNNQYEMMISMAAGNSKSLPRPAPTSLHEDHHQQQHQRKVVPARKREIRANLLENENYRNQELLDQQQQQQRRGYQQISSKRDHMTDSTQGGDRAEKLELVGRGEQRVPLKRGATKIVKCNKSDGSFYNPTHPRELQPARIATKFSSSMSSCAIEPESEDSLNFETYEDFLYYYEGKAHSKNERSKARQHRTTAGHGESEASRDEDDEVFEIPFTKVTSKVKKSGKPGSLRRDRRGDFSGEGCQVDDSIEVEFEPPFYGSNELRSLVSGLGAGDGTYATVSRDGDGFATSDRRKGNSRIPKKIGSEKHTYSRVYDRSLEMDHDPNATTSSDPSSSGRSRDCKPSSNRMLPNSRFSMERVECFDIGRDRNDIIQYHQDHKSEEPTKQQQQKQEPQQTTPQREAPQVPRRRMVGGEPASQPQVIGRTLPNIPQSSPAPAAESSPPFPQQTSKYAADPVNDSNNNNRRSSSPPAPPSRQGSNYSNRSYHQQPTPLSASTATKPNTTNYNNNIHTTSPYYNNSTPTTPVTPGGSINSHSNNGNSAPGIIFDDLSPTERDLMKSVQELDRMCESSSSMYPADSDEMSSVEGYPLSPGSIRREHHHHQRPSVSEGSKFSADSAYGSSLSRQSPSEQQQQQQQSQQHSTTMRRSQHHYRSGGNSKTASNNTTSHQLHHHFAVLNQQQDAFDNSSGSESSLPPISAIKAQKIELHPAPIGSTAYKECPAAALLNSHMSKFCHECGSRFTISSAKFCMECGVRRIMLE
ncbi:uncharacterized protein LOC129747718 isoform X7 [Uranotaenia lowii]|uniref:uncharacterized protein LOC129747718 isoform X7 n=1 Tax=Uranotaenia lowii TaxID=190385 RepID=UPI0024790242|nr:uncharacterized protein LOC129747718 isoform X7 [Uranotaenia lowii]